MIVLSRGYADKGTWRVQKKCPNCEGLLEIFEEDLGYDHRQETPYFCCVLCRYTCFIDVPQVIDNRLRRGFRDSY